MSKRYFFDQDNSCHWYLIPVERADEWVAWVSIPEDDEAAWDAPEFAERLNGGICGMSFTDPSRTR